MTQLKYGPQTYQIEKLILKIKSLTPEQVKELDVARSAALEAALDAAWEAALYATRSAARSADLDAAWYDAWYTARVAVWGDAWYAAEYAIMALVVCDLIGDEFAQEHYDLLTKPWRDVVGEFEEPEVGE